MENHKLADQYIRWALCMSAMPPGCPPEGHRHVHGNEYGDLIERWKVDLIRMRARRFGFRPCDIPDLEQTIVLELLGIDYDPNREGGTTERTFGIAVIDRQLKEALRSRSRHCRRINQEAQSLDAVPAVSEGVADSQHYRPQLRLDIESAMMGLTPTERTICEALREGHTQADIARTRGCSRAAVSKQVARMAQKLRQWGLDAHYPCRLPDSSTRPRTGHAYLRQHAMWDSVKVMRAPRVDSMGGVA